MIFVYSGYFHAHKLPYYSAYKHPLPTTTCAYIRVTPPTRTCAYIRVISTCAYILSSIFINQYHSHEGLKLLSYCWSYCKLSPHRQNFSLIYDICLCDVSKIPNAKQNLLKLLRYEKLSLHPFALFGRFIIL